MAAAVAVEAAQVLFEIMYPYLISQKQVGIDVKSMESWLSFLKATMEDNYGPQGSKVVEDRMHKIRDIAYDIEDVLEEFVFHCPPYTFHHHKFTRKTHMFAHQLYHGFPLHRISDKIACINRDIQVIKEQTARDFSVGSSNSVPLSPSSFAIKFNHDRPLPLLFGEEMVGFEEPKKEVMLQLLDGGDRLLVLAVDGPSGSGKTTFVKNVLCDQRVQKHFECRAWVRVTRKFDAEELFTSILKQVCGSNKDPYPAEDGTTTSAKLRAYLSGKRYIVALDDIWRRADWEYIKNEAFPDESCSSRVILTARSTKLAHNCASSSVHVYSLERLEWRQGWKLFCTKLFPDSHGKCPSDLKETSVKIVRRCEGLPLAIVAVCGALANKPRLPNEWKRFHDSLGDEINIDSNLTIITKGLQLSYMDLSTNLKCCFLYFSIFPEDYSVERGKLIRLWVAEHFAMETDCKTAEEVAEEYLNELIQRNLVHVSDWDFDGRPSTCRVLNLILEFIIHKCKDENFLSIFPTENTSHGQKIRRLSVHDDCTCIPENTDLCGVRSMFLLRLMNRPPSEFEKHLSKLMLVRVLDFEGAHLTEFPKDITRLILLRYLSLRNNKIKVIPTSIKNLSYLETMDLKQTDVTELPQEISYLHSLCHLFVYKIDSVAGDKADSIEGAKLKEGISNLTNLQDLTLVNLGQEGGNILKEIGKLFRLRKLGLTGLKQKQGKELCAAVESMENLATLDLTSATREEFLDLGELKIPPKTLQRVYLKGRLEQLPSWISSLDNLLRIDLKWSKLEHNPLQGLEQLPNLMELQLVDCFIGQYLLFDASCFKKLKILVIEGLMKVERIVIRDGAMGELRKISLGKCPQLRRFPKGLHYLIKIEELTLFDMAAEFVAGLRVKGSEEREWVKHIPVINSTWSLDDISGCF